MRDRVQNVLSADSGELPCKRCLSGVTMAARPAPPTLSLRKSDTEAQIEFDVPPPRRGYCAIHLITPSGDKHFYDANKGGLDPSASRGRRFLSNRSGT